VVVGSPSLFFNEVSYKAFASQMATRERVIYAGSNGGFLHGFHAGTWLTSPPAAQPGYDVGTGTELFGFMPWPSRQRIRHLPIDTGARDHYFVDGSPTVTDAWLWTDPLVDAKQPSGEEWRTVLVGGLRQGGESYYALDITKPGAPSCVAPATGSGYPCYLWEFPVEGDTRSYRGIAYEDMMGETWGEPILVKIRLKGNANPAKAWHERWVAVVTGGYQASGDPNDPSLAYQPASTKGRAIWILDLKTGDPIAVKAFDTSGDCTPYPPTSTPTYDPANPERNMCFAIASTPAVYDLSFDGYADTIVVGDLGGNVWKWSISVPGDDPAADPLASLAQPDWTFRKLFEAPVYYRKQGTSEEWQYKSFFFPPAATLVSGTMWLALGSGERADLLREGNPNRDGDNNRLYAFKDLDPLERAPTALSVITEGNLLNVSGNHNCSNVSSYKGWYIVGREGTEKWVTNADIFGGFLFVNSYLPTPATDPCEIGGESFLYGIRVQCGEGFFQDAAGNPVRDLALGAGLPTDPRITIGQGGVSTNRLIVNKQGGELINVQAPPGFGAGIGVYYWRELRQ
jgi:Tfp pilus tip-associated adhesin PilY1